MLPGFRFLFAAIVLSVSMLVFGLGAAALLRAAHEQFVSAPSLRAPPSSLFARQIDAPTPTLSMLRVETPTPDPKAPEPASVTTPSPELTALAATSPPPTAAAPQPATTTASIATSATGQRAVEAAAQAETRSPEPVIFKPNEPQQSQPAKSEPPIQAATDLAPVPPAGADESKVAVADEPAPTDPFEPYAVTPPPAIAPSSAPLSASASAASASDTIASSQTTASPGQVVKKPTRARRTKKHRRRAARSRSVRPTTVGPFGSPPS